MSTRAEFLAGERPDDVALFLSDAALSGSDELAEYGERVEGGVVLVLPGDRGRSLFATATGMDAMQFAQRAMGSEGDIDADLTGSACPHDDEDGDEEHATRFVFAFAEAQNEAVGDIYAEGDVIHAYAHCTCGAAYSDRWVAGDR